MKRLVLLTIAVTSIMFGSVALATGPTSGPEPGPGCFGLWRAGSVQDINDSGGPAGLTAFSVRAGTNSTINADNRATCAALGD